MSYLADVQMPKKEEISVAEHSEEEQVWEPSDESEEEVAVLPPNLTCDLPAKKEKIQMDDIFKPKAPPAKKELQIREKPVILPKIAPVKQKRKMSEKQLEALARGRANRAKNKKPVAAPAPAPVAAPVAAPEPAPAPAPVAQVQQQYSQQDLQEMVFQGVQRYDTERKKRKEVKKKALARQTHEKKVFSDINNALERTVPTSDPWANCFT
tara:strand:- start:1727 stop:2356 length:630 start_codon:yes stop_codon:yes gene_type:complete